MNSRKVIFIGPIGGGGVPKNGASAKNYHLINFLKKKDIKIITIDTEDWKTNPFILVRLALLILFNHSAKYILAANNESSYRIIKLLSILPIKRHIIYWVIGGSMADWIKNKKVQKGPFQIVDFFLVEGKLMQNTLESVGFTNALYVPNFKCIDYIPTRAQKHNALTRFVFLSRIIPEKGCKIIIDATKILNKSYRDKFIVDFYGPIDADYELEFNQSILGVTNISYKGFIDLRNQRNYDLFAEYDAMLFPTYWHGEGFPGIIIDAFICGLPVIASNWSLNAEIIHDGRTGIILKENSASALATAMSILIGNSELLQKMSKECSSSALAYDIERVVSDELLKTIGIC